MAKCFLPDDQYGSWNHVGQNEDGTLSVSCPPPSGAAVAELYYCNPPSAAMPPWIPPFEVASEDRAASASRNHSEAEKRRRDRINAQLATLRKLIPKSEKMDKAGLLGYVVEHVKELSTKAKEMSKFSTIPTETDEVTIDYLTEEKPTCQHNQNIYVKASICCEDRPQLFAELSSALKGLGLSIVDADLTSLGGRAKSVFVLCAKDSGAGPNSCTRSLKQSLKLVLSRVAVSSASPSYSARSKRQRFFYPNSY